MKALAAALILLTFSSATALAQSAAPASTNLPAPPPTNGFAYVEKLRQDCIAGRRMICGRILKVLPEGLVVESGYPSLRRKSLHGWLLPGTVSAERDPSLVEGKEPDALCVGLVFLTDFPKSRRLKPKPFDYVVLEGFPTGDFTYTSAGSLRRTVRRFSAVLEKAVNIDYAATVKPAHE